MPLSSVGGKWVSGDTIGVGAANIKTNLVIPYGTYTPSIGTDTVAGEICIDTTNNVLYVVNGANNAYALAFNQSLRTTDSPLFNTISLSSSLILPSNSWGSFLSTHASLELHRAASSTDSEIIRFGNGVAVDLLIGRKPASDSLYFTKFDGSLYSDLFSMDIYGNTALLGNLYLNTGEKLAFNTGSDSNWRIGRESSPSGANLATVTAIVIDIYGASNQGFMIRGSGTSELEVTSSGTLIGGTLTVPNGVIGSYLSGNYGASWASISLPSGVNGMQLVAYNSNAGVLASRLYIYTNSAWHYIMIT